MTSLTSLIERIEAATGPDRILDIDVFREIGAPLPTEFMERKIELEWDETDLCFVMPLDGMRIRYEPPYYTASIDAALTLLPEGYAVTDLMIWPEEPSSATVVGTTRRPFGKDHRMSWVHGAGDGTWRGNGATAPLAILAAILRARQAAQSGQAQTEARG